MVAIYIILLVVATVLNAIAFNTGNDKLEGAGILTGVVAAVFITIVISTADSTTGAFITYINGVRASSGVVSVAEAFTFFMIFGAVSIGGTRGLGWVIGHRRRKNFNQGSYSGKGISAAKLILAAAGIILGGCFLGAGISGFILAPQFATSNTLSTAAGVVIMGLSVWLLVGTIKGKRRGKS